VGLGEAVPFVLEEVGSVFCAHQWRGRLIKCRREFDHAGWKGRGWESSSCKTPGSEHRRQGDI
jgi:hypothetical protein